MKVLVIALISFLAISSGFMLFNNLKKTRKVPVRIVQKYNQWKLKFGKLYATPSESDFRLRVFEERSNWLDQSNTEYNEYVALNNLPPLSGPMFAFQSHSDLTTEEFKKSRTGLKLPAQIEVQDSVDLSSVQVPAKTLGQAAYQIRVRDQGECGSCYAFSAIATLEKHYYDLNKAQLDLSTQEIVDCSKEDNGCDGGWPAVTFNYIKSSGISSASQYPYTASDNQCRSSSTKRIYFGSSIASKSVTFNMANAQKYCNLGIISGITVYSSGKFSHLSSTDDIYDASASGECNQSVDHAVSMTAAGSNYVVIMNSWNTSWGVGGFKKVKPCSNNLWGTSNVIMHTYAQY